MECYLVRHAIAEDATPSIDDFDRMLTPEGVARMKQHVSALAECGVAFDEVWSSPLRRAIATAGLCAPLVPAGDVKVCEALAPGGPLATLIRDLFETSHERVALVGHEPDLGDLASGLLCGQTGLDLRFKKGGVARIDLHDPESPGELRWWLTPRQLRLMGR
jgi:phosphohistidine phosphatase